MPQLVPITIEALQLPYSAELDNAALTARAYFQRYAFQSRPLQATTGVTELQFYALPCNRTFNQHHFVPSEWLMVVTCAVAGHYPLFGVELQADPFSRHFSQARPTMLGGTIWTCTCPQPKGPCPHAQLLIDAAGFASKFDRLPFTGVSLSRREGGPEGIDKRSLTLEDVHKLTVRAVPTALPSSPLPEGAQLGVRIEPFTAGEAAAKLALVPVAIHPAGRAKAVTVTLLPALHSPNWTRSSIPDTERPWWRALRSMSTVESAAHALTVANEQDRDLLRKLLEGHRCVSQGSTVLSAADEPLSAFTTWRPITPVRQRAAVAIPEGSTWLNQDLGLLVDPEAKRVCFVHGPTALLSAIPRLPPVDEAQRAEIAAAWAKSELAKAVAPPSPMETGPVRVEKCTWTLVVDNGKSGLPSDRQTEYQPNLAVRLEPRFGTRLLSFGDVPVGWHRVKNAWVNYEEDQEGFLAAVQLLLANGYQHLTKNRFGCESMAWANDNARLLRAMLVVAKSGLPLQVTSRQTGKAPATRDWSTLQSVSWNVELVPQTGRPDRYSVTIGAEVGEQAVDAAALTRMSGQDASQVDILQGEMLHFPGDPARAEPCLRRIDADTWARVDKKAWSSAIATMDALLAACTRRGSQLEISRGALMGLAFEGHVLPGGAGALQKSALVTAKKLLDALDQDGPVDVPGLAKPLKPLQTNVLNWLMALRQTAYGGVLADDRGMGKTVDALAAVATYVHQARKTRQKVPPVIVAMEVKELKHWLRHAAEWTPDLKLHVHHGPKRRNDGAYLREQDLILTTYDILRTRRDELLALKPEFLFLDEATALKNPDRERWKVVNEFREGTTIVPITGTPIGRNLLDLWALIELAVPGLLGTRQEFMRRASALAPHGLESEGGDVRAKAFVQQLRTHIAPFLRRELKKNFPGQFPESVPMVQYVTLEDDEAADYEKRRLQAIEQVQATIDEHGWYQSRFKIDQILDALRQKCSFPGGRKAGERSTKGDYLVEMTRQLLDEGHRVLIFSHFNNIVTQLQKELNRAGISAGLYLGKPNARDRELDLFKAGHLQTLILSEIGKSGLDIPEADTVIIYDPWIDQSIMDQVADRANRLSSTYAKITVYQLVAADTVEEVAQGILARSKATTSAILDGQIGPVAALTFTRNDVDALLAASPLD